MSLLNTATGEPRANESVNVTVKITDSAGNVVCEETKREVTNDFGVLSMTVGSQDTFTNTDWSKLPLFIEATVDGRLIGRSQILSVPVAEHAKHTGVLTKELLCSKTWSVDGSTLKFDIDGNYNYESYRGTYEIDGNFITARTYEDKHYHYQLFKYIPEHNILVKIQLS